MPLLSEQAAQRGEPPALFLPAFQVRGPAGQEVLQRPAPGIQSARNTDDSKGWTSALDGLQVLFPDPGRKEFVRDFQNHFVIYNFFADDWPDPCIVVLVIELRLELVQRRLQSWCMGVSLQFWRKAVRS